MTWLYRINALTLLSLSLSLFFQTRGIDLSVVRTCVVVSEERPRTSLLSSFAALFSPLGLASHTISASFGCRVNSVICLQGGVTYVCVCMCNYSDFYVGGAAVAIPCVIICCLQVST